MGGDEGVSRILKMYVGKLPGELSGLSEALASGDLEALGENAHRLKSSTAMLGATRLAGLLAELEAAGKAADQGEARKWLAEVEAEAPKVEAEMKARALN